MNHLLEKIIRLLNLHIQIKSLKSYNVNNSGKKDSYHEEYELDKSDLVPASGDEAETWYNKTAGIMDKFRLIPRLIMMAYIYAFYSATTWFMALPDPTNAQAAFISTIVGAGAAFFGLYVGKPGASIPGKK